MKPARVLEVQETSIRIACCQDDHRPGGTQWLLHCLRLWSRLASRGDITYLDLALYSLLWPVGCSASQIMGPKHQRLLAPFPRARIGEQQRTQKSDAFSGESGGKCFSLGSGGPTEKHLTSNRAHFRLSTGHQFLPCGPPSHFRHGETENQRGQGTCPRSHNKPVLK